MPLPLRTFTWNKMKKYYEEQNEAESGDVVSKSISNMRAAGSVAKPQNVKVPDYVAQATKK